MSTTHTTTGPPTLFVSATIEDDSSGEQHLDNESPSHPLLVKPSGNALTSEIDLRSSMGAFGRLPDAMILLLLEYLDQKSLIQIGSTCRALFAYSAYDQLWRDLAAEQALSTFDWRGSWRASLRRLPSSSLPQINCGSLFSDALHRPFLCSRIDLRKYTAGIPQSQQIPRFADLTTTEFNASWTNRPFILTEPVKTWHVFEKWNERDLERHYGDVVFRAESVDWPLKMYLQYMSNTSDESPLYLFDRDFVRKMGLSVAPEGDYEPPPCFQEDLFTVLGDQRPDHRWLIVGPERSGSTFHKDPNATSAWNAVVRGSKYWIMFPPSVTPPGEYVSADQSEVTSPLSIAEWLLTCHAEARQTRGCLEGICHEGEVLHVPSGWWHLVVNLESAIAITQNFVPRSHVQSVVDFLHRKADQVSGFKTGIDDPLHLFVERLSTTYPDVSFSLEKTSKKRKWEDVVKDVQDESAEGAGFSFGFGSDLEDED
jgi:hypothetical protein